MQSRIQILQFTFPFQFSLKVFSLIITIAIPIWIFKVYLLIMTSIFSRLLRAAIAEAPFNSKESTISQSARAPFLSPFLFVISLINSINYLVLFFFFSFELDLMFYIVNNFFTFLLYVPITYFFNKYLKGINDQPK